MKVEEYIAFCIDLQKYVAENIVFVFLGTNFMHMRVRFDLLILDKFRVLSSFRNLPNITKT